VTEPVNFLVLRYSSQNESTLGLLFRIENEKREWICYTLEDEYRTIKWAEETRIPAGRYRLALRDYGDHHRRYRRKFPDIHMGMIEMLNVPGFTDILLHIGNRADDTAGCLLVGDTAEENVTSEGRIGSSTSAYLRVYPIIATMIKSRDVWIGYEDFDSPTEPKAA